MYKLVVNILILIGWSTLVRSQFYTVKPNLRVNDDFFRTFKYSSTTRQIIPRTDPDSLFFGFFPVWSAALACLTGACLFVSLVGMLCWLAGCNNPRNQLEREAQKLKKEQIEQDLVTMEEQLYDDISMRLSDTVVAVEKLVDNSTLFSNSKLISEFDSDSKYFADVKKKKFMRDHL